MSMHVRTPLVGTWEVFILPRQSDRGRSGKEDPYPMMYRSDEAVEGGEQGRAETSARTRRVTGGRRKEDSESDGVRNEEVG